MTNTVYNRPSRTKSKPPTALRQLSTQTQQAQDATQLSADDATVRLIGAVRSLIGEHEHVADRKFKGLMQIQVTGADIGDVLLALQDAEQRMGEKAEGIAERQVGQIDIDVFIVESAEGSHIEFRYGGVTIARSDVDVPDLQL